MTEVTNPVIVNWTPMLIKQDVAFRSGQTPTAERLNELFNLNIQQGDLNTKALTQLIHDFYGVAEYTDTYYADLDKLIAKTNTALNTVDSNITKTLELANAKLFELNDKLNLLEVSTNEYQFEVNTHLDEYDGKLDLQAQQFNLTMENSKKDTYAMLGVTADRIQELVSAGGITSLITQSANSIQQTINSVNDNLSTSITQQKNRIDFIATDYLTSATLSLAMQRDDVTNVMRSVITAQADDIRLKADALVVESDNFKLTAAGALDTTLAVLRSCYVYGNLFAVDANLSFTSLTTGNKMLIANGKIVTDGMIGIYNNDIYCQDLYINMYKPGLDKASDPNDPPSKYAKKITTYIAEKITEAGVGSGLTGPSCINVNVGAAGQANTVVALYNQGTTLCYDTAFRCTFSGTATSEAPNAAVSGSGNIGRVATSSREIKHHIVDVDRMFDLDKMYEVPVHSFVYNLDYLSDSDERYNLCIPGLIVEEVDEVMPILIDHNKDGSPKMWNSNIIIPCLLRLLQKQHTEIEKLKEVVGI